METKKVDTGSRLGSMIVDSLIYSFLTGGVLGPIVALSSFREIASGEPGFNIVFSTWYITLVVVLSAINTCKDSFNGRSIAKRIFKLQVLDNKSGAAASSMQCFVRNIFIIIWPVEFIITLINPERRLGDRVAGTRVAFYDDAREKSLPSFGNMVIVLLLALFSSGILHTPYYALGYFITKATPAVVAIQSSYNEEESKELEQFINGLDSMTGNAKVEVYDKMDKCDLKYIHVAVTLNNGHMGFMQGPGFMKMMLEAKIYSKYDPDKFIADFDVTGEKTGVLKTKRLHHDMRGLNGFTIMRYLGIMPKFH